MDDNTLLSDKSTVDVYGKMKIPRLNGCKMNTLTKKVMEMDKGRSDT